MDDASGDWTFARWRRQEQWPGHDSQVLAYAVHYTLPLVQVPPRGVWGKSGRPTCTTAENWLNRPLGPGTAVDDMVMRYLTAFGPATVADAQAWSGLTRLREVFDRLRARLRTFRGEDGRELFDVADGPRPGPDAPAPPRFLPDYDNVLLGHADRTHIVRDADRRHFPTTGESFGTILIDGFVGGIWKLEHKRRAAACLRIKLFHRLSSRDCAAVTEEGARLLDFAVADGVRDVRIVAKL